MSDHGSSAFLDQAAVKNMARVIAMKRGIPLPKTVHRRIAQEVAHTRGLCTYKSFEEFVAHRHPALLKHEYMRMQVRVANEVAEHRRMRVMVIIPTQYGKALADDTPVLTPAGWRCMGELQVGDHVFAGDGSITRVIAIPYKGVRPTYWVTPEDGAEAVRAADTHEWDVCLPDGTTQRRTTQDLAEHGVVWEYAGTTRASRAVRIPVAGVVQHLAQVLPVSPYVLGVWLGDGASAHASVTIGEQDRVALTQQIAAEGYTLTAQAQVVGITARSYHVTFAGVVRYAKAGSLHATLRELGVLHNKHIPEPYLRGSPEQRLALLQGLVDTDGHVSPRTGRVQFVNTNATLVRQVQELVHSLGAKAFWAERRAKLYGKDCGPAYSVEFYLPGAARLPRKAQHARAAYADGQARTKGARAITFAEAGSCAVTCITVEHPRHQFLAGRGLLVTHNSEIWSRLLPAYYLLKYPNRMVALSSYGAELAWELSGEARDNYAAVGGQFKEGSPKGSTRNWRTARRTGASGGMWATGIGGPGLGRGFNLGITDDPISPDQATRGPFLRRFQRWWPSTWLRGQRPGGSPLVFVMQRLGVDDPIDWLLSREEGKTAEGWHIVALDEIHSAEKYGRWSGPLGFPASCTVEPDWRAVGQVLAPEFRTPAEVERMQATSTATVVAAQRQQRPMRPTGDFWVLKWFEGRTYDQLPADAHNGGWDWDTAYTKEEQNSATAGVKSFRGAGEDHAFKIYIDDVQWDWLEFPELVALLTELVGPHHVEKKASGKSVVQTLKTYGITADEVGVQGDKLARASAVQVAATTGRVYINKLIYDKLLYGEQQGLLRITAEALQEDGEGLDLNDAFVQGLFRHLGIGAKKKRRAGFR